MAQLSIPLSSLSTASDTNLIGAPTVAGMDTITDDTIALEGWFGLYQIIAAVGFGVFQIPYNSWFLDSCRDSADYAVFQLYCFNIGGAVGSLLGIASFSYMPAKAMTVAAVVFVAGGAPLLALMCWLLPNNNNTIVSPQPQLPTNSKKNIVSAAGDADSNSGDVVSAILPSLRILMKSSEFRVLFLNNVILQVGEGIGTEFVAFAPYILFPGVTHYQDLLQLASLFFYASIGLSAVLTVCIGPAIQYYQVDKARIYSGIIIAFIVVCVLEFALCIPGIIITVDADNSLTRGVEESFTAAMGQSKAMGLVYTYIALQILLSALFAAGKVIFSLMVRDLVKLDTVMASSGGKSRASLYQAALGVPSRLLVVFLMVIPQLVFYSSGYKVVDNYDADDDSHDDLITNKYTWTSASFFELVLFQNVLSGLLAWASYVVIRDYKLNREVCREIDALCATHDSVSATAATGGGSGGDGWGRGVEGSRLGESLLQNGDNMNGSDGEGGGDKASANNKNNDDDKDEDDSNKSYAFSQADSEYSAVTDSSAIARLPLLSISKGDAASRSRPLCQLTNTQLSMLLLHFNDDELARLWKCWTKVGALGGGSAYRKESGDDANSSSLLRRNISDGTIDTKTSAGSLTEKHSNVHNSGMLHQPRFRTETETSDWLEASGIANITGGGGIGGLLNPLSGGLNNTTNNNQEGSLSGTEETGSLGRSQPSMMPGGGGSSMDEWLFHPIHWLRLRRFSQFVIIFLGPVALVAIAAGAVTQTIQRTVYVPLAVNLFALASAYIFYEYLRAVPVLRLSGAVTKYLRLALYSCDVNDATSRSVASITMLIPSSISSYLSAGLKVKSRTGTEDSARSSTASSANLNNNASRSASTRLSRMETVDKQPKDSYHVTSLLRAAATAGQAPPPSSRSMRAKSNNNGDDNIILIDEQDGFGRESLIAGRESLGSSGGDDGMIKTFSHHRGSTSGGSGLSVISLSYYGSEGDNNSKFGGFFGMSGSYLQRTNDDTGMLGNGFAEANMWALHWRLRTLMGSSGGGRGATTANSTTDAAGAGAEEESERRWLSVTSVSRARRLGILSSPGGQQQEDGVNEDDGDDVAAWLYRLAVCEPCAKQYSMSESLQPVLGSLLSALGALAILIVGVLFVTTIR
jgi:hypothetical protein